MKRFFDKELDSFQAKLQCMGKLAIENVQGAVSALLNHDLEQAKAVVSKDDAIDTLEVEIDHEAIRYLSLRSPLAEDLRLVTIGMKASHDFERIGDEATAIAKRAVKLANRPAIDNFFDIPRMAELTLDMLRDSLDSFIKRDMDKAHKLFIRDRVVNDLNRENARCIKAHIQEVPSLSPAGIELLFVAKSLEKVADHATNIAEELIFLVNGEDLRHTEKASRARRSTVKKTNRKTLRKPAKEKNTKKKSSAK